LTPFHCGLCIVNNGRCGNRKNADSVMMGGMGRRYILRIRYVYAVQIDFSDAADDCD